MTREEALQHFKEQLDIFGGEHAEAIKVAIEALQNKSRPFGDCSKCIHTYGTLGCCTTVSNEWVYDCEHGMEQYKSTKAEPSEDLISRADAIRVVEKNSYRMPGLTELKLKIEMEALPSADRQMVIKCKPFLSEEDFKAFAEQASDQNVILIP